MNKKRDSELFRLKKQVSDLKNKLHISHSKSQFKKIQDELTLAEQRLREYQKGLIEIEEVDWQKQ